ncbi:MAG: hypothetical protein U5L45_11845 [Saprospiraceae bacterium]|nr:hypothetical protein [Saprospiraceae bacterium]
MTKNPAKTATNASLLLGHTPPNAVNGTASVGHTGKLGKINYILKGTLQKRDIIRRKEDESRNANAFNKWR